MCLPWCALPPTAVDMRAPTIGRTASRARSERPRQRRWDVTGAPSINSEGTGVHSKGREHARPNATVGDLRGRHICRTAYLAHLLTEQGVWEGRLARPGTRLSSPFFRDFAHTLDVWHARFSGLRRPNLRDALALTQEEFEPRHGAS